MADWRERQLELLNKSVVWKQSVNAETLGDIDLKTPPSDENSHWQIEEVRIIVRRTEALTERSSQDNEKIVKWLPAPRPLIHIPKKILQIQAETGNDSGANMIPGSK